MSGTAEKIQQSQTLLIDADDTLWENNVYFERAIAGSFRFSIITSFLLSRCAKF